MQCGESYPQNSNGEIVGHHLECRDDGQQTADAAQMRVPGSRWRRQGVRQGYETRRHLIGEVGLRCRRSKLSKIIRQRDLSYPVNVPGYPLVIETVVGTKLNSVLLLHISVVDTGPFTVP